MTTISSGRTAHSPIERRRNLPKRQCKGHSAFPLRKGRVTPPKTLFVLRG